MLTNSILNKCCNNKWEVSNVGGVTIEGHVFKVNEENPKPMDTNAIDNDSLPSDLNSEHD